MHFTTAKTRHHGTPRYILLIGIILNFLCSPTTAYPVEASLDVEGVVKLEIQVKNLFPPFLTKILKSEGKEDLLPQFLQADIPIENFHLVTKTADSVPTQPKYDGMTTPKSNSDLSTLQHEGTHVETSTTEPDPHESSDDFNLQQDEKETAEIYRRFLLDNPVTPTVPPSSPSKRENLLEELAELLHTEH